MNQYPTTARTLFVTLTAAAGLLLPSGALGQDARLGVGPRPDAPPLVGETLDAPTGEYRAIDLRSGPVVNTTRASRVVWQEQIQVVDAAWLRLYFGDTRLDDGSLLRITSALDGEVQELDADGLARWGFSSAYFNGGLLTIELVAGPATIDNRISVIEYAMERGRADRRGEGNCGICGADDRVPSADNNFGRLFPVGCSATVFNEEGCLVTAGHCLGQGGVVQFNVPPSNADGSTNNPPVNDQFPVINEGGTDAGVGADYGAVLVGVNGNNNLPHQEYGTFIPLADSIPSSGTLSVRGYGVDSGDPDRSQTQQFHDGPILSVGGTSITYDIDVTFGNSGSSIIYDGAIIGVVTHCSGGCENYGNRIDDPAFVQIRATICSGEVPPCGPNESEDCNGNCYPTQWLGDGTCDDGSYSYNGVPIFLDCEELACDSGDCVCGTTGACCFGDTSCEVLTQADCDAQQGLYQGDDVACDATLCEPTVVPGNTCDDAVPAVTGVTPVDTTTLTDSQFGLPDGSQCPDTFLDWTNPDTNAVSPDQWLRWPAPGDGLATFSTCDAASFDTSLVLYEGSDCGSLIQVACNGDAAESAGCQQYFSEIQYQVTGGRTYYVRVGGWQAATGTGSLTISGEFGNEPSGACCLPDTPCQVLTATDCEAQEGVFQGPETSCDDDPCDDGSTESGACCYADNSCEIQPSATACAGTGGTWAGIGSTCDDCGQSAGGACCFGSTCSLQPDPQTCLAQGGAWIGGECAPGLCGSGWGFAYVITGTNLVTAAEAGPNFTADLYVTTPVGGRVDALAGTPTVPKTLTSSGGFYQSEVGGPMSTDVNPEFFEFFENLEHDSRVTIGAVDSTGAPFGANALQSVGIDFGPFEQGLGLSASNGLWFVLPTDPQGASQSFTAQDCSERNGVRVARVTALGLDSLVEFNAFVQGSLEGGVGLEGTVSGGFGYSPTEDCNANRIPDACDIANGTSLDDDLDGVPDECGCTCPGDATGDCLVTVDDILVAIGAFGQTGTDLAADVTGDGAVTVDDILQIIQYFGGC